METSPLPAKGCTLWPMLGTHDHWTYSEGSLACHTYCDTGNPFITVISEDPWHTHIARRLAVVLSLPVFTVAAWIRTSNLPLTHCANAVVKVVRISYYIWLHQVHTEALETFTPLIEYKKTQCAQYLPLELRVLFRWILLLKRVINMSAPG